MGRPLPIIDTENEHFWRSGANGQLRILRCRACGLWIHPPSPVCRRCRSRDVRPQTVTGAGTVSRFTVNYHKWQPDLDVPYVIASVELDEQPGLLVTTNIVGCPPTDVRSGMRVAVEFQQIEDVWLPLFSPEIKEQAK
jgi:uncharacterized OB-fold protein